jgi:ribosomal-protein-alanine N-acetyltransferase
MRNPRGYDERAQPGYNDRMGVRVDRMKMEDVPEVMAIERDSFSAPWPSSAYRRELTENRNAHYLVLRLADEPGHAPVVAPPASPERWGFLSALLPRVLLGHTPFAPHETTMAGYAGLWLMIDEAHVTTIATRPQFRGRGYGELLLASLVEIALDINARWLTLEVRVSNEPAQALYRKYGFHAAGTRKRYYSDNNEDALIMWTDELQADAFMARYQTLKDALLTRMIAAGELNEQDLPR